MFFTSQEINIKWSPNGTKLYDDFYGPEDTQWARAAPGACPEGGTTHQGAPGLLGAPWGVVLPFGLPIGTSLAHLVSSGPEKISKKFCCVWTSFGIDLLQSEKQAKNSNWHWALCQ